MREFLDGFESGDVSLWDETSNASCFAAPAKGMQGGYCLLANYGYVVKHVTARSEYYVAVKYRYPDPYSYDGTPIICFQNGNTKLGTVSLYSDNVFRITKGASNSVYLAQGPNLAPDTVFLIEAYYRPKTDATGRFIVKVNGVTVMDFTGQTSPAALQVDRIRFGNGYNNHYYDDVVIDTSSWVGQTTIQALTPAGAGASSQYTPSAGANYQCVDEVPPSDADYVSTNVADKIDTYTMGGLAGVIQSIKAVQVAVRANKQGAAVPTSLRGVVRSSGQDFPAAEAVPLSTTFRAYGFIWSKDPATGAAWTEAGVNAMGVGAMAISEVVAEVWTDLTAANLWKTPDGSNPWNGAGWTSAGSLLLYVNNPQLWPQHKPTKFRVTHDVANPNGVEIYLCSVEPVSGSQNVLADVWPYPSVQEITVDWGEGSNVGSLQYVAGGHITKIEAAFDNSPYVPPTIAFDAGTPHLA